MTQGWRYSLQPLITCRSASVLTDKKGLAGTGYRRVAPTLNSKKNNTNREIVFLCPSIEKKMAHSC